MSRSMLSRIVRLEGRVVAAQQPPFRIMVLSATALASEERSGPVLPEFEDSIPIIYFSEVDARL
jgi:hypothetical protein